MPAPADTAPDAPALASVKQRLQEIADEYRATLARLLAEIKERRLGELRETLSRPPEKLP